jgi:hypothetical protein
MLPPSGAPFNFIKTVAGKVVSADDAYQRVVRQAGASLARDAIDRRIVDSLTHRTGGLIDSQESFRDAGGKLPGIDDLPESHRPAGFDTDADGMSDEWEKQHGLNPSEPSDGQAVNAGKGGYTNLELYLDSLVPK